MRADLNLAEARIAELTDDPSAVGVPDWELVDQLGEDCDAIIDLYLRGQVVVPLAQGDGTPRAIRVIKAALWRKRVYAHREITQVPEQILAEEKWALGQLERIASGEDLLGLPEQPGSTPPGPDGAGVERAHRKFGRRRDRLG